MRFKFLGDADAPDWFIGEITVLARIVRRIAATGD
jgi:hypothetical protein